MSISSGNLPANHVEETAGFERENELSLFDLWGVLMRRRLAIVLVALTVVFFTALYAYIVPARFTYKTAIEIGYYIKDGTSVRVPIQAPASVEQRLKSAFVPMARQEVDDPDIRAPQVDVGPPDKSGVIVITTEETETEQPRVSALHERIVELTLQAHSEIMATVRADVQQLLEGRERQLEYLQERAIERSRIQPLQEAVATSKRQLQTIRTNYQSQRARMDNQIENLKLRLADLRDQQQLLKGQVVRLDLEKGLVKQQVGKTEATLEELLSAQRQAASEISASPETMSLMMMSTQIAQVQMRLDERQSRLEIALPQELDALNNGLEENGRKQVRVSNQANVLNKESAKLDHDYKTNLADRQARVDVAETALAKEHLKYAKALEDQEFSVRDARNKLGEIVPTRTLFVALRSPERAGPGTAFLLVLGAMLGGMLGVFSAFAVEFVSRANQYLSDAG